MFLRSSIVGDEHDQKQGAQDGRQRSTKDEEAHNKKKTSQLIQEEKAQSGNVS